MSALDECECSASHYKYFTAGERACATDWTGGWEGPKAGLDILVRRKIPVRSHTQKLS